MALRYGFFKDHPRLCGEKSATTSGGMSGSGSPPPMRGKVAGQDKCFSQLRITPAYAGKRLFFQEMLHIHQDHPRLCGEKFPRSSVILDCVRITPAYAGKSHGKRRIRRDHGDHPRLCGEKHSKLFAYIVKLGSPPPMRGKGRTAKYCNRYHRITPAYAGKSHSLKVGVIL